jgi:dolichol-phosphate mannosyltransferase
MVSVVATLQDDGARVEGFVRAVHGVLRGHYENYELVLIDDGSRDDTQARLGPLLAELDCVRVVRLSRRFGREAALQAGLEGAIGDVVVVLQIGADEPALVPALVQAARSGSGAVCGVDPVRAGQSALQRQGAKLFYRVCRELLDLELVEDATGLLALSRPALNALLLIKDKHRHLQVFLPYIGFDLQRYVYQPAGERGRRLGLLGGLERALAIAVTGSLRPLRLVSWLSFAASAFNGLYILYVVAIALFKRDVAEGWPTLSLQQGLMFFLLFLVLAVLSEYVARVLAESRQRPAYLIRDERNSSVVVADVERRNVVSDSA